MQREDFAWLKGYTHRGWEAGGTADFLHFGDARAALGALQRNCGLHRKEREALTWLVTRLREEAHKLTSQRISEDQLDLADALEKCIPCAAPAAKSLGAEAPQVYMLHAENGFRRIGEILGAFGQGLRDACDVAATGSHRVARPHYEQEELNIAYDRGLSLGRPLEKAGEAK